MCYVYEFMPECLFLDEGEGLCTLAAGSSLSGLASFVLTQTASLKSWFAIEP